MARSHGPAVASGAALRQTSYLMLLQVGSRLLTFVLNAAVARQVGPELFGVANVHFYLIMTTMLFIAREGLRRACLRASSGSTGSVNTVTARLRFQRVLHLCWYVGMPIASVLAIALGALGRVYPPMMAPHYDVALVLYVVAALIEMVGEPLYIMSTMLMWVKPRVFIELGAVLCRTVVTAVMVLYLQHALLAFACAQLIYAVVLTLGYYAYFFYRLRVHPDPSLPLHSLWDLVPHGPGASAVVENSSSTNSSVDTHGPSMALVRGFTVQSCEKLALTEGEKFVLAGFNNNNLAETGVYSLVSNLGSLVARMIFQPLEESSYAEFSTLLGSNAHGVPTALPARRHAIVILTTLLKCVLMLGLIFVCFGPAYSYFLLDILYGQQWVATSAPLALSWYCIYVLLMAVNGITEAFVFAAIPAAALSVYNVLLLLFSVVYIGASVLLLPFGSVGLILANCVNLSARILYSAVFIRQFLQQAALEFHTDSTATPTHLTASTSRAVSSLFQWSVFCRAVLPSFPLAVCLLASALTTHTSAVFFQVGSASISTEAEGVLVQPGVKGWIMARQAVLWTYAGHVGVGVLALALTSWCFVKTEQPFMQTLRELLGSRRK